MADSKTYFYKKMPDENFNIEIFRKDDIRQGDSFKRHWHEHMQVYYIISGIALIECGNNSFKASPGNIVIVNGNELHYLEGISDDLSFYVLRIEPMFLFSNQVDLLQTKYLTPLYQNRIAFFNLIENDPKITSCITDMIDEYENRKMGYELAVKALAYELLVLLLRGYIQKIISRKESHEKIQSLKRFEAVLSLMESNYAETIHLEELAGLVNLSTCHFCRTFKQITGRTTTEYLNGVRVRKAAELLEDSDLNITEIALTCGFDSANYFSRIFKRLYGVSPSKYRESRRWTAK